MHCPRIHFLGIILFAFVVINWSCYAADQSKCTRDDDKSCHDRVQFPEAGEDNTTELLASIYSFAFDNKYGGYTKDVQMGPPQALINKEDHPITKVVKFSENIQNTVEYTVAPVFTQIQSTLVTNKVGIGLNPIVPLELEEKLRESLKADYRYINNHQDTCNTTKIKVVQPQTVKVAESVTVDVCEKCDFTGIITMLENFPLNYTAVAKVIGVRANKKMTAKEIRFHLPTDMNHVWNYDPYMMAVTVKDSMTAGFLFNTSVSRICEPIPGCNNDRRSVSSVAAGRTIRQTNDDHPLVAEVYENMGSFGGKFGEIGKAVGSSDEFQWSVFSESTFF